MVSTGRVSSSESSYVAHNAHNFAGTTSGENAASNAFRWDLRWARKRRASASLISAAPGRPAASESLRSRPRTIGICMACTYPGLMSPNIYLGCSDMAPPAPFDQKGWCDPPSPLSGSESITPADPHPADAVRCKTSWEKLTCPEGVVNLSPGRATFIVSTFARIEARTNAAQLPQRAHHQPRAISSTSERATSATTSRLRVYTPAGIGAASALPRFQRLVHVRAREPQRTESTPPALLQNRQQQRERQDLRV